MPPAKYCPNCGILGNGELCFVCAAESPGYLLGPMDVKRGFNQATASGLPFWALDPRPEDIRIADIAAQLARVCRFGGALRDDVDHYSVAQHSVLVSLHVPPQFALEGLLHDAAEAYIGDTLKPLKHALPDLKKIEDELDWAIRAKFGLPEKKSPEVKRADYEAVITERRDLLPKDLAVDWGTPNLEPWPERIKWQGSLTARWVFLVRFAQLTGTQVEGPANAPTHSQLVLPP